MKAILRSLLAVLIVTSVALESLPNVSADTIYLKNGGVIHGKIAQDPELKDTSRVTFSNGGYLLLKNGDVRKSVTNDLGTFKNRDEEGLPVPAALPTGKLTRVTLKKAKTDFYGAASYIGWPKDSGDDETVLLALPGGGELRIPTANIESQREISEREAGLVPAVEPAAGPIKTTHKVTLKNDRIVLGNLEATKDDEPIKIRVGELGVLRFDRGEVEAVEAKEGTIVTPPPSEDPVTPTTPKVEIPAALIEELKAKLRREIIHELLEGIIDGKVDAKLDAAIENAQKGGNLRLPIDALPADSILEAQYHVRELCRQRTRNRVRAESHLKTYGPGVIAYLEPAASHPLALTRRAVQRIIRDVGDYRGAPLAIDSLDDQDEFVRSLAHEALKKLFKTNIKYNAKGSEASRLAAQKEFRSAWLDLVKLEARETLASRAKSLLDN